MGLKFKVTAKDGTQYSAEKVQPSKKLFSRDAEEEKKEEKKEEVILSEKEVKLLKALAEKSEELLALLEKKGVEEKKEDKSTPKKDESEEFEFEEEEEFKANDEDVVDLPDDEEEEEPQHGDGLLDVDDDLAEVKDGCGTHDSKKSFGATETKRSVDDSIVDEQEEINRAWAERYNKKGDNR